MKTILFNQLESCQINLMHTFKMQMSLFTFSILISTNTSFGQPATTCNLLQNHDFTYSNSAALTNPDPFTFGYVPAWIPIQSPQLSGIKFSSSPSSALMWAGGYQYHEGVFQHVSNLIPGKPYIYTIKAAKYPGSPNVASLKTYLTDSAYTLLVGSSQVLNGPMQPVLFVNSISDTIFQQFFTCNFIPTKTWEHLVIHPDNPVGGNPPAQWVNIDDVELIENFGFAGRDTFTCIPGTTIKIGTGACTGITGFSFAWFVNTLSGSSISTNADVNVSPSVSTSYILARTYLGCTSYDTVNVEVKTILDPDLGPDLVLCDSPVTATLTTHYDDSTMYVWQPSWISGYGLNTHIAWYSSQYILTVFKNGCVLSDTVNITILPPVKIFPDTAHICNSDSVTFCATPGLASYYWSTGDSTTCITVFDAGIYTLHVTDSNGCEALSYAVLNRYDPIEVDLGPDILMCGNGCVTLSPAIKKSNTIINFSYLWSTSDTTPTICPNVTGDYWVCVTDSLGCMDCDTITINIRAYSSPSATNIGPICLYATPFQLTHATPPGGEYIARGVNHNILYPTAMGVGTHEVAYYYEVDSMCLDSVIFQVEIIDGPYIELPDIQTCITDTHQQILTVLYNIENLTVTWTGSTINGAYRPSDLARGIHTITATVTDPITGCTYTATGHILVGDVFTANYTDYPIPSEGWECEGAIIKHEASGAYQYKWININTSEIVSFQSIAFLKSNGDYRLYASDSIGNCPIDSADININIANCCERQPEYSETDFALVGSVMHLRTNNIQLNEQKLCFNRNIIVEKDQILEINNSYVIMNGCNKILVKNGGKLIMNNTEIGYCDWQGIEAGGCYDCCQLGMSNHNVCVFPNCQRVAEVEIDDSRIHNADIGIFLGLRDDDNGCTYLSKDYSGGAVLSLTNSVMSNNYIDVMFREYDYIGIQTSCEVFDTSNQRNQSIVQNNFFINPSVTHHCDTFAIDLINTKGSPISRCHIVDLSEKPLLSPAASIGQTLRGYLEPYNPPFNSTKNIKLDALPNIKNNYYSNTGCSILKHYK